MISRKSNSVENVKEPVCVCGGSLLTTHGNKQDVEDENLDGIQIQGKCNISRSKTERFMFLLQERLNVFSQSTAFGRMGDSSEMVSH